MKKIIFLLSLAVLAGCTSDAGGGAATASSVSPGIERAAAGPVRRDYKVFGVLPGAGTDGKDLLSEITGTATVANKIEEALK